MKIFSKTLNHEVDVDVLEKEQNGQVLTVIKHNSLKDIIYNQVGLCKDPDCIKIEAIHLSAPYPVYKCTLWDKEKNRCVVEVGSAKPETLLDEIAKNYADESAANRAFDHAAISYLQFPGRQLSDEEVGLFLPSDLMGAIPSEDLSTDKQMQQFIEEHEKAEELPPIHENISSLPEPTEIEDNKMVTPNIEVVKDDEEDPIEPKFEAMNPPVDDGNVEDAGEVVISFGKFSKTPMKVKDVIVKDPGWVEKAINIASPSEAIKPGIDALKLYVKNNS